MGLNRARLWLFFILSRAGSRHLPRGWRAPTGHMQTPTTNTNGEEKPSQRVRYSTVPNSKSDPVALHRPRNENFSKLSPRETLLGEKRILDGGKNLQSVRGKVCQAIKQQVTIGKCRDHRRGDKCTLIYTGNFDAFKCSPPSKEQAAGSAYISHSGLPVWVFGLNGRKLFETRLRYFK